ncbi:MAG: hypothetical protein RJA22_2450 [Verrucomicrobiota bacterium]
MLRLLAVAALTLAAGAVYSLRVNPEVAFFRAGDATKQAWHRRLREAHTNVVVIFGGSSCGTSIDARGLLDRHGLPVLNAGLGAGMGARILTRYALASVRPGDTLLVALEPELLTGSIDHEPLGVQFALAAGHGSLLGREPLSRWPGLALNLRPGGAHVFAMLGKLLTGQPLYRYARAEWREGGHHEVAARRPIADPSLEPWHLSADGRRALADLRDEARARGVRVAYVLPWQYCPPVRTPEHRRRNLAFLREVVEILPALREPSAGSHSVAGDFADTNMHPTPEAARRRSDELAASLRDWSLWTPAALEIAMAGGRP